MKLHGTDSNKPPGHSNLHGVVTLLLSAQTLVRMLLISTKTLRSQFTWLLYILEVLSQSSVIPMISMDSIPIASNSLDAWWEMSQSVLKMLISMLIHMITQSISPPFSKDLSLTQRLTCLIRSLPCMKESSFLTWMVTFKSQTNGMKLTLESNLFQEQLYKQFSTCRDHCFLKTTYYLIRLLNLLWFPSSTSTDQEISLKIKSIMFWVILKLVLSWKRSYFL